MKYSVNHSRGPLFISVLIVLIFIRSNESFSKTFYVATYGNNAYSGLNIDSALATVAAAISKISAGDTIYVRAGTYITTSQITISANGIDTLQRSCLFAYPDERPLLDFSSMGTPRVSGSADGIRLTGRYWHIKGINIKGAPHNGIAINGGWHNKIEYCEVYENRNTGLQLSNGASYNKIINCDSYFNRDSTSATSYDGNADGFAPKLNVGSYNYFYGCRAWQNSDDGWDGYMRPATAGTDTAKTTIENCWCFMNGYLKSGVAGTGNGNGFKMGGGDKVGSASNGDSLRHDMTLINCLSFNNLVKGFDQNNNRGSMTLINCTGYNDGTYNFSVPGIIRVGETLEVANCISLGSSGVNLSGVPNAILLTNSWMSPFSGAAISDFISVDTTGVRGTRKPDGSLPDISFMHLVAGDQFIDAGTNVGLPYNGSAQDLGCFESNYLSGVKNGNSSMISEFKLYQNYPNPFNPSTKITFHVGTYGHTSLKIFDILGREIKTLVNGIQTEGKHTVEWNGKNSAGQDVGSGIYFYQLKSASGNISTRKMILLR